MIQDIKIKYLKKRFNAEMRLKIYRRMSRLLRRGEDQLAMLKNLYKVVSKNGKRKNSVEARIVNDWLRRREMSETLAGAIGHWVPFEEVVLLEAAIRDGDYSTVLPDIEAVLKGRKGIAGAITGALLYPVLLFTASCILLTSFAQSIIPGFLQSLPKGQPLPSEAELVMNAGSILGDYWFAIIALVFGFASLVPVLLVRWTGKGREYLEYIPPFSIYRMIQGVSFLKAYAVLRNSGLPQRESVEKILQNSKGYMRSRIMPVPVLIRGGKTFAEALSLTGHVFPSPDINDELLTVPDGEAEGKEINLIADDWLHENVQAVNKIGAALKAAGLVTIGTILITILGAIYGLQDLIASSAYV